MLRRPPRSTRTDTRFPYTTLFRSMVIEYLERRGLEVDYASDGLEGYRLAHDNSYDAIVLDLMLPRMDGVAVCRKLRDEAKKATPRSEEHTSELRSLMRISYAVFCLKKKKTRNKKSQQ